MRGSSLGIRSIRWAGVTTLTGLFLVSSAHAEYEPVSPKTPESVSPPPTPPEPSVAPEPSFSPSPVVQRKRHVHDGAYLSASIGFSYVVAWGDGPRGPASTNGLGPEIGVAVGDALVPGLALAFTIRFNSTNATFHGGPFEYAAIDASGRILPASNKATTWAPHAGALVDWFPDPCSGFHIGASVGFGGMSVSNDADDSNWNSTAPGATALIGYFDPSSRKMSSGLTFIVGLAGRANLTDSDKSQTGYRMMPVFFALEAQLLYF